MPLPKTARVNIDVVIMSVDGGYIGFTADGATAAFRDDQRPPLKVQTLIFDKDRFKDKAAVRAWIKETEGFEMPKEIDETDESFRVRQATPGGFEKGSFRTFKVTEGVQAVGGREQ